MPTMTESASEILVTVTGRAGTFTIWSFLAEDRSGYLISDHHGQEVGWWGNLDWRLAVVEASDLARGAILARP